MTEATEARPTRTHDLHRYEVLAPDWLTKHEPRTIEHSQEHPDGSVSVGLMSEVGDGVFVNWTQCHRCKLHFTSCACAEGPQEPPSLTRSRVARWSRSFDARPDLPSSRELVGQALKALRDRGYVIGEIPAPERVEVQVPDHSLFLRLFTAAAGCEAPEGTQLDDVLATFQEAYDQFAGHITVDDLVDEDAKDFARETLGEDATEDEVTELAEQRAARDLKEFDVDF